MSERKVKLLALDLDGTLVDSAPDIAHCLGSALEAIGYAAPGEARTRVWIGDGLETLIARAIAHGTGGQVESTIASEARHQAALTAFLSCYADNLFTRSRLYPGVLPVLDELRERGLRLCCITNKRFAFSQELLVQAGIRDRFELLLGGDSLPEKKPSPLPLTTAAESLGVEPRTAILVGDSHQDLRAARAAGYGFVLADYGYGKIDETELGTSQRIRTFAELPAVLGGS
ncbi:MAG TPA: HAD-IA family hydrolase [Gammaproteobacteria bacterium]|nr:HAD-IA family hydrolase [Gammaproteobacteria bacterium]